MSYILKWGLCTHCPHQIHGCQSSIVEYEMHGSTDMTATDSSRRSLELLSIKVWQV